MVYIEVLNLKKDRLVLSFYIQYSLTEVQKFLHKFSELNNKNLIKK